jgi:hypothetical protein
MKSYFFFLIWDVQTQLDGQQLSSSPWCPLCMKSLEKPWEKGWSSGSRTTVFRFGHGFFLQHRNDETQSFLLTFGGGVLQAKHDVDEGDFQWGSISGDPPCDGGRARGSSYGGQLSAGGGANMGSWRRVTLYVRGWGKVLRGSSGLTRLRILLYLQNHV